MLKKADFEGWTDWQTWYVNLLIGNSRSTHDAAMLGVRHAMASGASRGLPKQGIVNLCARKFAERFRGIRDQAKREYEENALEARTESGEFEARQIEGKKPPSTGSRAGDVLAEAMDLIHSDMGGQSGWLEPWTEPNWAEIAENWLDETETQDRAVREEKREAPRGEGMPVENSFDKRFMKEMGIKASTGLTYLSVLADFGGPRPASGGPEKCGCEEGACVLRHAAGECPHPAAVLVEALGIESRLCQECADTKRKGAPGEVKILGTIGPDEGGAAGSAPGGRLVKLTPEEEHA